MKEATGELNMTVVTVVAIAAVGAFFYAFVWPAIQTSLNRTTFCNGAIASTCTGTGADRVCTYDADGNGATDTDETNVSCPEGTGGTGGTGGTDAP